MTFCTTTTIKQYHDPSTLIPIYSNIQRKDLEISTVPNFAPVKNCTASVHEKKWSSTKHLFPYERCAAVEITSDIEAYLFFLTEHVRPFEVFSKHVRELFIVHFSAIVANRIVGNYLIINLLFLNSSIMIINPCSTRVIFLHKNQSVCWHNLTKHKI